MPAQQNNQTEKDFQQGLSSAQSAAQTGANAAKSALKNGKKTIQTGKAVIKGGKKAVEIGVKVGKVVVEATSQIIAFLIANPIILAILIIAAILLLAIVLSMDGGWMRKDTASTTGHKEPYLLEKDKDKAYDEIIDVVSDSITEGYEESVKVAEEACEEYIEENFNDHESEVVYEVMKDDQDEVARYITPWILAVNGAIQYEVDETGLSLYGEVEEENEYNSIGDKFRRVVKEYADTQLFYVDIENINADEVELVTVEEPIIDELTGQPMLDAMGNELTREKEVYQGTVYIGIGYYIGDYKLEDIEHAIDNIYDKRKELTTTTREQYAEYMDEYIHDILLEEIGTREYNPWGGYGQGTLKVFLEYLNFLDVDWSNIDLVPGTIEALLALGEHGGAFDQNLINLIRDAERNGVLTMTSHTPNGGYYCTEWAHLFMYLAYGKDYNTNPGTDGGDGNGANVARTLAMRYDDWEMASVPTAGAIFSVQYTNGGAGHVGMITKVEGDRVWWCDGNIGGGYNTRINQETSLSEFMTKFGGPVQFANHK